MSQYLEALLVSVQVVGLIALKWGVPLLPLVAFFSLAKARRATQRRGRRG